MTLRMGGMERGTKAPAQGAHLDSIVGGDEWLNVQLQLLSLQASHRNRRISKWRSRMAWKALRPSQQTATHPLDCLIQAMLLLAERVPSQLQLG